MKRGVHGTEQAALVAEYIQEANMDASTLKNDEYKYAIAVVGMAGSYCNAPTVDDLWSNLATGKEAVRFLDRATLQRNGCPEHILSHPRFVPATAMMTDVDLFDADFFGYTAAEAKLMDPQLRLMLQTAWHAFENANLSLEKLSGLTGVFAGAHRSDYLMCHMGPEYSIQVGMQALTASLFNGQDYLSTWISYKLGLTGPSLNIQTACSTGLVTVATACQNLLDYSCDTALAVTGAVFNPRDWGYLAETGSILSADGHCRPFDAAAGGTITGEGVGAVVLKRLQDAIEENLCVLGIIRGYAVNNDGSIRAGYATPSVSGQKSLLTQALASAGVSENSIRYIECHGTGTQLGDPIEFKALQSVFAQDARTEPCFLGSIKANLGHLGACAGMAGLHKVLLMFRHGAIPPQINFTSPNPEMGMDKTAFRINTELCDWPQGTPMLAGVSSFGLGGTNCHLVVEGCENKPVPGYSHAPLPLCLGARSEKALRRMCAAWATFLQSHKGTDLTSEAESALSGRSSMPWRTACYASTPSEAAQCLLSPRPFQQVFANGQTQKTALVIYETGDADRHFCHALFQQVKPFATAFSACAACCSDMQGPSLMALLSSPVPEGDSILSGKHQALLSFAMTFSLGFLLRVSGVPVHMAAGQGAGRLAAGVLSGVLPLTEALSQIGGFSPPDSSAIPGNWQFPEAEWVSPQQNAQDTPDMALDACRKRNAEIYLILGRRNGGTAGAEADLWLELCPRNERDLKDAPRHFAEVLADLFMAGVDIRPERQNPLAQIPLYPFEQTRYWADTSKSFCSMLRQPEVLDFSAPSRQPGQCAGSSVTGCNGTSTNGASSQEGAAQAEPSIEQCLCGIWNNALGTNDIGLDDDFFARGGSSLSAIAIVADISKYTGLTIQLRELMRLKTINHVISRLAELAEEDIQQS